MKNVAITFGLLITSLLILFSIAGRYNINNNTNQLWVGGFSLLFLCIGILLSKKLYKNQKANAHPTPLAINHNALAQAGISRREAEILLLIHDGLSNRQIADRLFISEHTVKKHISNLFAKLNVERRTEAIKKAKELSATA
jgi:DNA-binding NarL/FixJ family response regulator